MRFERGIDPKESMRIGVSKDLIHVNGIQVSFSISRESQSNSKPVHSSDWKEFLEMWESGKWDSRKLIRILNLRGFRKRFTTIHINQISIKKRLDFEEYTQAVFSGNYVECEMGEGEELFVSLAGKIYKLGAKKFHDGWWI